MDIMADNQTEAVLSQLDRGEADDRTRDKVSAVLLRAQTKMSRQLDEMQKSLWTPDQLANLVARKHGELCSHCQMHVQPKEATGWFEAVLSSESIRYFILVLLLVWAVIYITTGTDGIDAVKSAAVSTLVGGPK